MEFIHKPHLKYNHVHQTLIGIYLGVWSFTPRTYSPRSNLIPYDNRRHLEAFTVAAPVLPWPNSDKPVILHVFLDLIQRAPSPFCSPLSVGSKRNATHTELLEKLTLGGEMHQRIITILKLLDGPELEFTPPTSPDQLTFQDRRRRPELVEDSDSELETFRKRFWKSRQRNRRISSILDPENRNSSNNCDQDQKEEVNGDFVFKGSLALENGIEKLWDYYSKQNRYVFMFSAPLPSAQLQRASKVKVHTTFVDLSHESRVNNAEKRSPFDNILTCSSFPHLQARMNRREPNRAVEQVVLSELSHQEKQAPVEKHTAQISLVDVASAMDADKGEEYSGESKLCPESLVDQPSTPPGVNEKCEDIQEAQNRQAFVVLENDASSIADDSSLIQCSTSSNKAVQEQEKIVYGGLLLASIPSTPPCPLS
ncbi:hypothetical protein DFJ43DRAFT_1044741 [Lentinula guzmanii]|uniref:Uncharacterized protein n=1 Tax=Lentinula guzmanii TaxID=2804957 RepID=A0AA38J1M2_9AGAR|nr:hypothetical protein DFJ43DRAFT_1044741 [Lentinula guzmanii]